MEWNALPGQMKQRNYQLWEMRTGHIENCIRLLEQRIQETELLVHTYKIEAINKDTGLRFHRPDSIKRLDVVIRKWQFQIAMFKRELSYRTREQYRDFLKHWHTNHKIRNWVWMLVFADYLAEQGWRVMENRIRKIAKDCHNYQIQREKLMEAVYTDGVPQLLEAAKDLGKKMAQDRNRETMKRFF